MNLISLNESQDTELQEDLDKLIVLVESIFDKPSPTGSNTTNHFCSRQNCLESNDSSRLSQCATSRRVQNGERRMFVLSL